MKPITLTFTLILLLNIGCTTNPDECDCKSSFDWMTKTFMENDAGYNTLVETNNLDGVETHTKKLRNKAKKTDSIEECAEIMKEWLHFFRKAHIGINVKRPEPVKQHNTSSKPNRKTPSLKTLSDNNLYLKVHSFEYRYKKQIDNLIKQNESKLASIPNLIIDIRGSGGGSDASFYPLIPLMYTNSLRICGVEYYVSEQNALAIEQRAEKLNNKSYLQAAEKMRSTQEMFMMFHDSVITISLDSIQPYPKKIGIICDRYNASADEGFLLFAKQSQKVKIFGEPTIGAKDYSNMNGVISPDENFELKYAMSRTTIRNDYPIDGIGIQPDFFLDRFLEEDWVEYTRGILEQ